MSKTRKPSRPTGQFEKKLAAYTLAGAATLVAPGIAKANVVYVPENITVNETGSLNLNTLSGLSAADITITADASGPFNRVRASTLPGSQVLMDPPAVTSG